MNNITEIIIGEDGRYHSPHSEYSTPLINKMQAHLQKKHGEQWDKDGDKLVRQMPPAAVKPTAAKTAVVVKETVPQEPEAKEN
jgi:hypothetical protein